MNCERLEGGRICKEDTPPIIKKPHEFPLPTYVACCDKFVFQSTYVHWHGRIFLPL